MVLKLIYISYRQIQKKQTGLLKQDRFEKKFTPSIIESSELKDASDNQKQAEYNQGDANRGCYD